MIPEYKTLLEVGAVKEEPSNKFPHLKKCTCFGYSLLVIPGSKSWNYSSVQKKLVEHYRQKARKAFRSPGP